MSETISNNNAAKTDNLRISSRVETLSTSVIILDPKTQSRVGISKEKLEEYAQDWEDDVDFPPIDVFTDGESYWLADGWHRLLSAKQVGIQQIKARVHQGSFDDAILFSCGANSDHGLPRTNEDKRKAVLTLLQHPEWGQWSNREIGRQVRVHHQTVAAIRSSLGEKPTEVKAKRNGREYTHKVKESPESVEPNTVKDEQKQIAVSLGVPASGLPSIKRNDGIEQEEEMFPATYTSVEVEIALSTMPEEDLERTFRRVNQSLTDGQVKAIHRAIAHRLIWEGDVA